MLTGRRAFRGDSGVETMSAILREEPPDPVGPIPPALSQIVRHCLEKRPEDRFQSARDLAFALESLSSTASSTAAAPALAARPRSPRSLPWIAAAAALALGVAAGRALPRAAPARTEARFAVPPAPGASSIGSLALSPSGSSLVYVATAEDGADRVFVRDLSSLSARALPGTEGATFPFFSPDGRQVGFFNGKSIAAVDLVSGAVKTLCPAREARGSSWGRDGFVVFANHAGAEILRVPENGGEAKVLLAAAKDESSIRWPSFMPDGRRFLYESFSKGNETSVRVASLDGGPPRTVVNGASNAHWAAGELVYATGRRLVAQRADAGSLALSGPAVPLAEDVLWDGFSSGYVGFAVAQNGTLAFLPGGTSFSRLVWHDRSGKDLGSVGPDGAYFEPALSPDEKTVALSRAQADTWSSDIWLLDLVRGGLARVSTAGAAATPLFSADGKRVLYTTFPEGRVFSRDTSGAGEEKLLFQDQTFCVLEDLAPDGRLFYTTLDLRTYACQSFVRTPGGERIPALSGPANLQHAHLSPDGKHLAYVSDESGGPEVFIRSWPQEGDRFAISAGGGSQPQWRGDGKELFYATPDHRIMAVPIATEPRYEPGRPVLLFRARILPEVEARNHYVATRDGQRFLVNEWRPEDATRAITVVLGAPRPKG
jgi:Tol biopolymer transport system component